jgi:hypothetical protein
MEEQRLFDELIKTLLLSTTVLYLFSCSNGAQEKKTGTVTIPLKDSVIVVAFKDTGPDSITFASADVVPAKHRIGEASWKDVVEYRIGKRAYLLSRHSKDQKLVPAYMNGFVETLQDAYADHRPLVLSPDDIWLILCQGFSIHLNEHFKEYQSKVFVSDKKETLAVRNDSLGLRNAAPWQNLIGGFTKEAKSYLKQDLYSWMVPSFTTTDSTVHTVYEITLLESVQKAFNYVAETGCGIPTITLKGKVSDWEEIESRIEHFRDFGLGSWVSNLKPILHEFTEARKGKVNKRFWNGIYKESSAYGVYNISGWMLKYFPYMKKYVNAGNKTITMGDEKDDNGIPASYQQPLETFNYVPNEFMDADNYMLSTYTTRNFPGGFAKIDVEWISHDPKGKLSAHQEKLEIYGGFLGIVQNHQNLSLRPLIAWAVCKQNAPVLTDPFGGENLKVDQVPHHNLKHQPDVWISNPMPIPVKGQWADTSAEHFVTFGTRVPVGLPIYNADGHKSYKEGIDEMQNFLTDTLRKSIFKGQKHLPILHLRFAVTWAGTVAAVEIKKDAWNETERKSITSILMHLPHTWSPATGVLINDEGGDKKVVRMNAMVSLDLKP